MIVGGAGKFPILDEGAGVLTFAHTKFTGALPQSVYYWRDTVVSTGYSEKSSDTPTTGRIASDSGTLRSLSTTKGSVIVAPPEVVNATINNEYWFHRAFATPELAAQTVPAGTWTVYAAPYESNGYVNHFARYYCYILRSGSNVGTIFGPLTEDLEDNTAVYTGRITASGSVGPFSIEAGDRIVLEVWSNGTCPYTTNWFERFPYGGTTEITDESTTNVSPACKLVCPALTEQSPPQTAYPSAAVATLGGYLPGFAAAVTAWATVAICSAAVPEPSAQNISSPQTASPAAAGCSAGAYSATGSTSREISRVSQVGPLGLPQAYHTIAAKGTGSQYALPSAAAFNSLAYDPTLTYGVTAEPATAAATTAAYDPTNDAAVTAQPLAAACTTGAYGPVSGALAHPEAAACSTAAPTPTVTPGPVTASPVVATCSSGAYSASAATATARPGAQFTWVGPHGLPIKFHTIPVKVGSQTAEPAAAACSTAGADPTAEPGLATASPAAASCTIGVYDAIATGATAPQTASPSAATCTTNVYAPTITPANTVAPDAASCTSAAYAPSLIYGNSSAPSAAYSTAGAYNPTTTQAVTATPAAASASSLALDPTTDLGPSPNAYPAAAAATCGVYAPTIDATVFYELTVDVWTCPERGRDWTVPERGRTWTVPST